MTSEQFVHHTNPRSTGFSNSEAYHKRSHSQQLDQEAAELQRCNDLALRTEHVTTAELLSYDRTTNTLSTKKFRGRELFHCIWNSTYWLGRLRGARPIDSGILKARMEELGQWLRKYHGSSTDTAGESLGVRSWLARSFQRKLNEIAVDHLLSARRLRQIERRFMPALDVISSVGYPRSRNSFVCRVHGDFILYNMLISEDYDIHVVDFGETKVSSNLVDVARFYSGIWAIAHTNTVRRRLLLPMANAFLDCYGLSDDEKESPLFESLLAYNFLIHLEGCHFMKRLLSTTSRLEMRKITNVGMRWIEKRLT